MEELLKRTVGGTIADCNERFGYELLEAEERGAPHTIKDACLIHPGVHNSPFDPHSRVVYRDPFDLKGEPRNWVLKDGALEAHKDWLS